MAEPTNPFPQYVPRSHNAGTPTTSRSNVSRDGFVVQEGIQTERYIDRNVQRHQRASLEKQQQAKNILDSLRGGSGPPQNVQISILDSVRGSQQNSEYPSHRNSAQNSPSGTPLASPRNATRPTKKKPSTNLRKKNRGSLAVTPIPTPVVGATPQGSPRGGKNTEQKTNADHEPNENEGNGDGGIKDGNGPTIPDKATKSTHPRQKRTSLEKIGDLLSSLNPQHVSDHSAKVAAKIAVQNSGSGLITMSTDVPGAEKGVQGTSGLQAVGLSEKSQQFEYKEVKMERARRKREEERQERKQAREKRIADGIARRKVEDRKSTSVKIGETLKHGLQRIGLYRKDIEIKGGLAQEAVVGLCLTQADLRHLKRMFKRLDVSKDGTVEVLELLTMMGEPENIYTYAIFSMIDVDQSGSIDFEEFIRLMATYTMFLKADIAKFVFESFSVDGDEYLDELEYFELCRVVEEEFPGGSPGGNNATWNTLLLKYDHDRTDHLDFQMFLQICRVYPKLTFSAERLQMKIQNYTMGERWFIRLLEKKKRAEDTVAYMSLNNGKMPPISKFDNFFYKYVACGLLPHPSEGRKLKDNEYLLALGRPMYSRQAGLTDREERIAVTKNYFQS